MPSLIEQPTYDSGIYPSFIDKLKTIYQTMDRQYQAAADHYGFNCTGCRDNCCRSRFYHHTLLEFLYLLKGVGTLDEEKQKEIKRSASAVCRKYREADEKGTNEALMCPLNFDGLCIIYAYRPMICRLHGIPHELKYPGGESVYRPGCDAFSQQCLEKPYFFFDRTPLYAEMSRLERELKQVAGITRKIKMSVAEMLTAGLGFPDR